jgi:hypothetical protein
LTVLRSKTVNAIGLLSVGRVSFLQIFRIVITENKQSWLHFFVALWILMHIGADAADPGRIEGPIYADYVAALHLATWLESIFSSLAFYA